MFTFDKAVFLRPLRGAVIALTALAIGLGGITASATPAQANSDFDKLILGAVGLAVVGAAIKDSKKRDERREAQWHHDKHLQHARPPVQPPRHNCVPTGRPGQMLCGPGVHQRPTSRHSQYAPRPQPPKAGWHHNRPHQPPRDHR